MSAPKTNIERQVSRHRGPLYGMLAVGGFVAVLFIGWLFYETSGATDATEVPPATTPETTVEPTTTAPATGTPAPATDAQPTAQP
jgi:multidrug efflux pump subunit AcrA (membrane-fusion protein)